MLVNMPGKLKIIIVAALGGLLIFGGFQYSLRMENEIRIVEEIPKPQQMEEEENALPPMLLVHVVGAVEKPGVYALEEGKRIDDAVKIALPTDKADLSLINLASPLQDGMQIYVPQKGEKPETIRTMAGSGNLSAKININMAGAAELEKLPGIGPVLAQRIIDYREKKGAFKTIEDITRVSGIGPAVFEKLKSRIIVN